MTSISSLIPIRRRLLRSELELELELAHAHARALSSFGKSTLTPYDVMHVHYTCSFSSSGVVFCLYVYPLLVSVQSSLLLLFFFLRYGAIIPRPFLGFESDWNT